MERYKCNNCKFKTTSKRNLRVHIKLVHDFKFFTCGECEYKAKTKVSLKYHKKNKHETQELICSECPKTFPNSANIQVHMNKEHTKIEEGENTKREYKMVINKSKLDDVKCVKALA